jgi:signal transduction histidine kinase
MQQGERRPIFLGIAAILSVIGLLAFDLHRDREARFEAAESRATALAAGLVEHADRTFESIDLALELALDSLRAMPQWSVGGTRPALMRATDKLPHLRNLVLVGPDGTLLTDTTDSIERPSLRDRPYFVAHRDQPSLGLLLGAPLQGRKTGEVWIPASRRIVGDRKEFRGVVLATVDPEFFRTFVQRMALQGDHGAAALLLLRDGTMLARFGAGAPAVAAVASNGPGARQDNALIGEMLPRSPNGATRDYVAADGSHRVMAYQSSESFPIVVCITVPRGAIVDAWLRRALSAGAVAAGAILLIGLATYSAHRRIRALQLATRSAELAAEHAESAVRTRARFLARVSHELRTPLHAILGFADLIRDEAPGSALAEHAGQIHRAGIELHALIEDLIDLGRIDAGQARIEPAPMRFDELVRRVAADLTERHGPLELSELPPTVVTHDRRLLARVLRRFFEETRTGALAGSPVRLSVAVAAEMIELSLARGGIAEEELRPRPEMIGVDAVAPDEEAANTAGALRLLELVGGHTLGLELGGATVGRRLRLPIQAPLAA